MKYNVQHEKHYKPYAELGHTSWHLLDHAKKYEEGSLLQLKACSVFMAFTFEAYLNHVGSEEVKFWEEIERTPFKKKLNIIQSVLPKLNVDKSQNPFQDVLSLFKLRDELAHGKTKTFTSPLDTISPSDANGYIFLNASQSLLPWGELTIKSVESKYKHLKEAIELINSARSHPDDSLWDPGECSSTITSNQPK